MSDYAAPDAKSAELAHRARQESDDARRRLQGCTPDRLRSILYDRAQRRADRLFALHQLLMAFQPRSAPKAAELLEPLLDDPDRLVRKMATKYCPSTPERRAVLHRRLETASEGEREEAAWSLAADKDESLFPILQRWLAGSDLPRRQAAMASLVALGTADAWRLLEDEFSRGGRDEDDRFILALHLAPRAAGPARDLLREVSRRATGHGSVAAATTLWTCEPAEGLRLMRGILDDGDLPARQGMVDQISALAGLPHRFTADGLAEAGCWVDQQLEQHATA